ncbi:MAG: ABC transporter permease, partial [Lachnospiraceae bacterium]|nr:ABC transporter permease [Lachnospiraceae bacterium]
MSDFLSIFTLDFLYAAIRLAAPILLAAIGELMLEKGGIFNLGIEGGMLMGGFFGVLGSYYTENVWGGFLFALLIGAVLGLLFGWAVISLHAHQAVVGTGLNIFATGLTALLSRTIWGESAVIEVDAFERLRFPLLSDLPGIGHLLFDHTPLIYVAFLSVPIAWFILYRTSWGLKIRAIGEYPKAADTMGIHVIRYKYLMSMVGWMCAAASGTILTLGFSNMWTDGIASSRGYYAIACVILGQWSPA